MSLDEQIARERAELERAPVIKPADRLYERCHFCGQMGLAFQTVVEPRPHGSNQTPVVRLKGACCYG